MGLSESPTIWQSYTNNVVSSIPDRSKYLVIMDYLSFHSGKHCHKKYLEDLLRGKNITQEMPTF